MAKSALTNLYTTLKTNLLSVRDDNDNNIVGFVSFFNNNKAGENFKANTNNVSVYFELINIDWQTKNFAGNNTSWEQIGIASFRLHCFRKSLKDDDLATLEIIDKCNDISRAVTVSYGENFNTVQRTGDSQDTSHDNLIDWQIEFSASVNEQANCLDRTLVNPDIVVSKTIKW